MDGEEKKACEDLGYPGQKSPWTREGAFQWCCLRTGTHTWAGFAFPTFSHLKVEALLWTSFFGLFWGWRRRAGARGRCEVSLGWTGCLCFPVTQWGYRESTSLGTDNKVGESKPLCVSIVGEIISSPIKTFPALEGDEDFPSLSCCVPVCTFYIMPLVPRVP